MAIDVFQHFITSAQRMVWRSLTCRETREKLANERFEVVGQGESFVETNSPAAVRLEISLSACLLDVVA